MTASELPVSPILRIPGHQELGLPFDRLRRHYVDGLNEEWTFVMLVRWFGCRCILNRRINTICGWKIPALLTLQPEHVLTKNVLGEGRIGEEPVAETQYLTSPTTKNHRTENVSTNS